MTESNPNCARRDNPSGDAVAGDAVHGDKIAGDKFTGDKIGREQINIGAVHGDLYLHSAADDEAAKRAALHLKYLRHWFPPHRLRNVSLANLNSDRDEQADLLDLYVPLPVDFALTVRTEEGQIIDWWGGRPAEGQVRDEERRQQEAAASRRHWPDLGVAENALQPLIAPIQARFAAQQDAGRKVYDRDYQQPPFAAHHAAALRIHFILLGDPGSGKSSFLRHLTLCLAGTLLHAADDREVPAAATLDPLFADWPQPTLIGYTPLYLELHDVVRTAFPAPSAPLTAISEQILWRYIEGHSELAQFRALLQHLLQQEALILLLDGLDEIPDADRAERRNQMIAFINALKVQYPALRIVITSRPYAYHAAEWRPTGFGHTALAPLQRDQFQRLATALFAAAASADPQADALTFVAALNNHPDMDPKLHANPLLFTLLAALWLADEQRQLPATQADLYRRAVDLLLDQWTRPRVNEQALTTLLGLTREELRGVLETLACTVHEQGTPGEDGQAQDSTQFAAAELFTILYDADLPDERTRPILAYLEKKAGLLLSPTPRQFRFSHRSFQEHLAACELTCQETKRVPPVAADRRFPNGLLRRVFDAPQLWRNVALLAADELVRQGQGDDLWLLLDDLCQPYREHGTHAAAVTVALTIARRHKLFDRDPFDRANRLIRSLYDELRAVAHRVLTDDLNFAPEERNIAGELLGRRPEHDTRKGVGCRPDGLPDIDWVMILETDEQGRREFIYQQDERRSEPTFWMARYPVPMGSFRRLLMPKTAFTIHVGGKGWPRRRMRRQALAIKRSNSGTTRANGSVGTTPSRSVAG